MGSFMTDFRHPFDPGALIYSGGPCPICGKETLITRRLTPDPDHRTGLRYRESTDCGCRARPHPKTSGSSPDGRRA